MGGRPSGLSQAEFEARADQRRRDRMARIDAMSPELRELVNVYGLAIVDCCTDLGVNKARHIKHIVETVLDNFSPTRGTYSVQGTPSPLVRERHHTERNNGYR